VPENLIRLPILPDELAQSYRARIARVNGWASGELTMKNLNRWITPQPIYQKDMPAVEVLAVVADMEIMSFVRKHTMLPFTRAIKSNHTDIPHGSTARRTLLGTRAYVPTRQQHYFCRVCVKEDMDEQGFSFWRRTHQMPGLLWCLTHEAALTAVSSSNEYFRLPNECESEGVDVRQERVVEAQNNHYVRQFINISVALSNSERPVQENDAMVLIRDGLQKAAIYSEVVNNRSEIGTFFTEKFEPQWLREVLVRGNKSIDHVLKQLNKTVKNGKFSGVVTYAIFFACLYETSELALEALKTLLDGNRNARIRKRITRVKNKKVKVKYDKHPQLDEKFFRDAYIASGGNHVTVGKLLKLNRPHVKKIMGQLGLPSMGRNDPSKMRRVVLQLIEGKKSLTEIARQHKFQLEDLQLRLLEVANPFLRLVDTLTKNKYCGDEGELSSQS
jgi:transposase-like protein